MGEIYIGDYDKASLIDKTKKIYIVGDKIDGIEAETISFKESIMYKYYFRWLSEINDDCALILNNILKKQQRNALEYNCIRYYARQAGTVTVFNDFPLIDSKNDFMILYDMIQPDPFWKREYDDIERFENVHFNLQIAIHKTDVMLPEKCVSEYEKLKSDCIESVKRDADIIPRRLLRFSEKHKSKYGVFDSLADLKQEMNVAVSQLKVDKYFYSELERKVGEINGIGEKLQRKERS